MKYKTAERLDDLSTPFQYGRLYRVFKPCLWIVISFICLSQLSTTAHASGKTIITVLGDSLSAGYGLARQQAFPQQLQSALTARGFNVEIRNAGVSGDTAEDGLARLDWAVGADVQAVIVQLGANDALRGHSPARMQKALAAILTRLKQRRITVLLAGMKAPRNMGADYISAFDRVYPGLARQYETLFFPFFLEGIAIKAEFNLSDGMHPNAKGVSRIVKNILPLAEQLIRQAGLKSGE